MTILESRVNTQDDTFRSNREGMLAAVAALREVEASVRATEEKARAKYHKRGQMLPRERVHLLLDRGSPFLELSTLCGYKQHDDKDGSLAGGNMIAGIGYVEGVRCLIVASNSAIKGGTMTPLGVQKTLRLQEIALQQKLPVVSLIESGGANLMYQAELFIPGGRTFANQARLSAAGIPQVTIVHGSSTAGGAYMPGLSDYVIMVRKNAKVFLAGPPLLKAATGEIAVDEDLGGAEMHCQQAGTAEFLPRTMPTPSASRATSCAACTGMPTAPRCRVCRCGRRTTTSRRSAAWSPPTTASPTIRARSSRAWSTAPSSSSSRSSTTARPSAVVP